jgi:hypothetical protein
MCGRGVRLFCLFVAARLLAPVAAHIRFAAALLRRRRGSAPLPFRPVENGRDGIVGSDVRRRRQLQQAAMSSDGPVNPRLFNQASKSVAVQLALKKAESISKRRSGTRGAVSTATRRTSEHEGTLEELAQIAVGVPVGHAPPDARGQRLSCHFGVSSQKHPSSER